MTIAYCSQSLCASSQDLLRIYNKEVQSHPCFKHTFKNNAVYLNMHGSENLALDPFEYQKKIVIECIHGLIVSVLGTIAYKELGFFPDYFTHHPQSKRTRTHFHNHQTFS